MFDICHPTYYHMSQLGCNDQVKLSTAFYVYMELCEVKRYWDVNYKYSSELELFYLEAKKSKTAKFDTFIPWPAFHNLTLDLISNIQKELNKEKFTFVFKDGDTTSVYYSIGAGIVKPAAPEETNTIKQKAEKKFALEREINRNTANLYERALSLDDDKDIIEHKKDETDMEIFHSAMSSLGAPVDSEPNNLNEGRLVEKIESENFDFQDSNVNKLDSNQKDECVKSEKLSSDVEKSDVPLLLCIPE